MNKSIFLIYFRFIDSSFDRQKKNVACNQMNNIWAVICQNIHDNPHFVVMKNLELDCLEKEIQYIDARLKLLEYKRELHKMFGNPTLLTKI